MRTEENVSSQSLLKVYSGGELVRPSHGTQARLIILLLFVTLSLSVFAQNGDVSLSPAVLRTTQAGAANAPVTVIAFLDFQCPYCARSTSVLRELTATYPDQVRVVIKNSPLSIHPMSPLLHEAAMAAAAQGKFWEMYDVLYARQTQKLNDDGLVAIAKSLGIDAARFSRDLRAHRYLPLVERDRLEAQALGVNVTPTFFINGKKVEGFASTATLKRAVDDELRKINPTAVKAASAVELRIKNIDVKQASYRGIPNASVQIVEFSDLQCPYCRRQVEALKQLVNAYPGKITWYFKNYVLSFHPDSPLAHRALMAAKAQGKFWEMHDLIFENQSSIKKNDLIQFAAKLGLDISKFNADLNDPAIQAQIEADQIEGERLGVSGTPMMFINGRPITGVHTFAELQSVVEDELKIGPQSAVQVASSETQKFDLSRGRADAPVTITWYADLSSPLSMQADQLLKSVQGTYPKDVRVVFKNRPVAVYPFAEQVHQAAMAAAAQNKFWEMEHALVSLQSRPTRDDLMRVAQQIGLDTRKFTAALDGGTYREAVAQDVLEARGLDVRGSPVFFVNSIRLDGVQTLSKMQEVIEGELKRKKEAGALRASTSMSTEKALPARAGSSGQARTAEVESK